MLKLDPIWQPEAQQLHFRLLLEAMSRPGRCQRLPVIPEDGPLALSVLASLLDAAVSLADPHGLLREQDWPMLLAQHATAEQADFILCDASRVPDFMPRLGSLPKPEQSATLILVLAELGTELDKADLLLKLSGPGIARHETLGVSGLAKEWIDRREDWVSAFPLGVDMILLDAVCIAALPRTTRVELS